MTSTTIKTPVHEHSTAKYAAVIKDENLAVIPAATLTTLTLTLYDLDSTNLDIVNGRSAQNVLNTNNVTVDGSGNLVWTLQPADNTHGGESEFRNHLALFQYTWAAGAKRGSHEVRYSVEKITKVTAL